MPRDRSPKSIARKISDDHIPRKSIVEDFITIGEEVITDLMSIDDMTNEEKHDLGKKVIVNVANASKGFKIPLPGKLVFLRPIVWAIKNKLLDLLADFVIKAIFKDAPSK